LSLIEALFRSLIANYVARTPDSRQKKASDIYSYWHAFYFRLLRQARKVTLPYNDLSAELYERAANETVGRRKFFTTSSSLMGHGQLEMRVGDEVAVFDCWRTPFVLRIRIKEQRFVLLGECHVQG
jgi:hypothetical protein